MEAEWSPAMYWCGPGAKMGTRFLYPEPANLPHNPQFRPSPVHRPSFPCSFLS